MRPPRTRLAVELALQNGLDTAAKEAAVDVSSPTAEARPLNHLQIVRLGKTLDQRRAEAAG
jgi:hypothetical protein